MTILLKYRRIQVISNLSDSSKRQKKCGHVMEKSLYFFDIFQLRLNFKKSKIMHRIPYKLVKITTTVTT